MDEIFQEGLDIPAPEHLARRALELDPLIRNFPSVEVFAPKCRTSGHERPRRDLVPVKLHPFVLDELRENGIKMSRHCAISKCLTLPLSRTWKRKRGTSGRCKASAAAVGSSKPLTRQS